MVIMATTKSESSTVSLDSFDCGDKIEKLKNNTEIIISHIPASKIALEKSITNAIYMNKIIKGW